MTDALLPCPFCGCTNVYPVSPSLGHSSWRVFCDDCHAEGPQIPSCNSDEGEARCQWVWQIRQPTQSDVERVARALAQADRIEICSDATYALSSYGHKAQAALAAMRQPTQSDALLDAEGVKIYWYRQGKDDGVEHERAKIVAWLRENSTPHNDIDEWADEIEAGEHLK